MHFHISLPMNFSHWCLIEESWFYRKGLQWRRQDFFGGGTPRPLKGYHAPPRRGSWGRQPPDGSELSFYKTMQSIRKWIHFSKYQRFFLQKNPFFPKKNFENWTHFTRISVFFERLFKNLNFLEGPYKSREIFDEFYYIVEKFIKNLKK